ncbi:DUF885 domain-containing protein [Brevundimonas sp.]|uniref:DUF885 domain-containing protein n=1 Tax=Brevundimonas sp. TaxID=1871086 RepID=UPI00391A9593
MIDRRRLLLTAAAGGALCAAPALARVSQDADARLDGLMAQRFEESLERSPERATSLGLDRGDKAHLASRLTDASPEAVEASRARVVREWEELQAFDTAGLSAAGRINHAVAAFSAETAARGARFTYGSGIGRPGPYVISQLAGSYFNTPDFLANQHRIEDAAGAEAYLARLEAFSETLEHETARIQTDAAQGVALTRVILDKTITQVSGLRDTPTDQTTLVAALVRKTAELGLYGYGDRAAALVDERIKPALDRQVQVLEGQRGTAGDDVGVWRLPDGEAFYAQGLRSNTTTTLSAAEIHAMGLEQVADIAAEIDAIMRPMGMTEGTVGERVTALNNDPQYLYPNTDEGRAELLAALNAQVEALDPLLPRLFGRLPRSSVEIRRVPVEIQTGAPGGYYQGPPLDGSRPGAYYINLRDTANWPKFALPTLTYHEASPGHHLQVALQRESGHLPDWRRAGGFSAYNEGWALYAESVAGDDLDVYADDPVGRIGYLLSYLFRATRLVVDTGLHDKRWSRQQAIDYMVAQGVKPPNAAQSEIDRYCVMPGQACAYKVGHTVIARLRADAEARPGFDLRAFHDRVLENGSMPLAVLEDVMRP